MGSFRVSTCDGCDEASISTSRAAGFTEATWLDRTGHPHSDQLHLVERFTRMDKDTLQDDLTFEDHKAYTKPLTGQKIFKFRPTWSLEEWACEDSRFFDDFMKKTVAGGNK